MNNHESFFEDNGTLHVQIPAKDVRWIDFLSFSRAINSNNKGWNSSTYWKPRGLEPLSNASDCLKEWTRNSLAARAQPTPRRDDFKLQREFSQERADVARAAPEMDLDKLSENAINARLYQKYCNSTTGPFPGKLYGYEVPLCEDANEQLKVDLLGVAEHLFVIELKQARSPSNSPLLALVELICYAVQITRCRKRLLHEDSRLRADHFRTIDLFIAAPERYWSYWKCREDEMLKMKRIVDGVNQAFNGTGTKLALSEFFRVLPEHMNP